MHTDQPRLGVVPYTIAGLSFVPGFGCLLGTVALLWGLVTRKPGGARLAMIAGGGMLANVVYYGVLFFMLSKGVGPFRDVWKMSARTQLTQLVSTIEFARLQSGHYPESLDSLRTMVPTGMWSMATDPASARPGAEPRNFYYALVDTSHYYLRAVGDDGRPFTSDDIVPEVHPRPGDRIGLLIERR